MSGVLVKFDGERMVQYYRPAKCLAEHRWIEQHPGLMTMLCDECLTYATYRKDLMARLVEDTP